MGSRTESVERVIAAPPEVIFALLADPTRHADIDGGDHVRGTSEASRRLELGSRFGIDMHEGVSYSTVNTVVELEPNRRIAWQTVPDMFARAFIGGRIWRYELEPVDGGTLVRETWDITQERNAWAVQLYRGRARAAMEATLARIDELVTEA